MKIIRRLILLLGLFVFVIAVGAAEPVKFALGADNRGMPGFVTVLQRIKALPGSPVQFLISPGDEDPPATTQQQISEVFGASFPWYPVIGNHEFKYMPYLRTYFVEHLKSKVKPGPAGTTESTYSFDAGAVHIAVVNAYWNGQSESGSDCKTQNVVLAEQRAWLAADLKTSTKPWKLVIGHPPAFPQPDKDWNDARHIGESLDRYPAERDAFWKLLDEQRVTAYFCGHTHRYSRFQPPGSKVWQFDAGQARGDNKDWKYDTFLLVTGDEKQLKFDTYRNLKERGQFAVTDTLLLGKPN